jgi:hypothetical protein
VSIQPKPKSSGALTKVMEFMVTLMKTHFTYCTVHPTHNHLCC